MHYDAHRQHFFVGKAVRKRAIAVRLEEYRLSQGMTWRQVAERLQLSVPMLMQVRSGIRNMSALAMRRFEDAERVAKTEAGARKVVEGLIDDQGTARELIERVSAETGPLPIPLRYRRVVGVESLPKNVILRHPSDTAREKILTLFRRTLDPRIILLSCIADETFDEDVFAKITSSCLQDLQQVAMVMFFGPRWRSIVVKMASDDFAQ